MTTTHSHHPLVEAYLGDLERALTGADPRERAETLASVREHLAAAVPAGATAADVRRAIAELGSVDVIAAEVTPEAPLPPRRATDPLSTVAIAAAIAGAVLLVPLPFVGVPLAAIALVAAVAHLRGKRQGRRMTWAALVIAIATLLAAGAMALTLLPASGADTPVSDPAQTAPR